MILDSALRYSNRHQLVVNIVKSLTDYQDIWADIWAVQEGECTKTKKGQIWDDTKLMSAYVPDC